MQKKKATYFETQILVVLTDQVQVVVETATKGPRLIAVAREVDEAQARRAVEHRERLHEHVHRVVHEGRLRLLRESERSVLGLLFNSHFLAGPSIRNRSRI